MDLAAALGLGDRELVSFVGAGGKKTAMSQLADQAVAQGLKAGYTTTAHMPPPSDLPFVIADPDTLESDLETSDTDPIAFAREYVSSPERVDEKVRGYRPDIVSSLFETGRFDWLLVKADGARMREFKAPGSAEPPIPSRSTFVVPVVSVHAVGESLTDDVAHRVDRIESCASISRGDRITPETIGQVLAHSAGGLKRIPDEATVVPLVNKADTRALADRAREILSTAFERSSRFDRGLVCSFESDHVIPVSARD